MVLALPCTACGKPRGVVSTVCHIRSSRLHCCVPMQGKHAGQIRGMLVPRKFVGSELWIYSHGAPASQLSSKVELSTEDKHCWIAMSPAVRKIPAEPNLDINFQGSSQSTLIQLLVLISTDYLILSKLVFDWADSYDAKVHFPSNPTSIRH